jgi:ubiquinone/menaquinone biosynthesis C-methylase UbiE
MKLDLGCGRSKFQDCIGVDRQNFPGVDVVGNALNYLKTLPENSVGYIHMSHFLEHLGVTDRIALFNESWRVLIPGGLVRVISPDFSCASAYGDPTHVMPPISKWTFVYLEKLFRDTCCTDSGYTCDFEIVENNVINCGAITCIMAILKKVG